MDFRERLNNSLHYTLTSADQMIQQMMVVGNVQGLENIEASPKSNNVDWDRLR